MSNDLSIGFSKKNYGYDKIIFGKNSVKKKISVVVPCYNEQEAIPIFYREICPIMEKMKAVADFELIFVDDGSTDSTLDVIKALPDGNGEVRFVSFSRNFGKEAALYAGLEKSSGDCVATRRVTRKGEPPIRSFFARCFYRIINKISKTEIVDGARDFQFMRRDMVDAILSLKEYNRFSKGIFSWVGFRTKWLEYENVKRSAGESKWSFWKLFLYSLDGIVGFSTVPLGLASIAGGDRLLDCVCDDLCHHCENHSVWRPGIGMAFTCLYYYFHWRYSIIVYGNLGSISF